MAHYKHGSMNTEAQEKAFAGFIGVVSKGAMVVIAVLLFMAIVNG